MAAKKWDGRGDPPSKAAAIAWLKSQGVDMTDAAYWWSDPRAETRTAAQMGKDARALVATQPKAKAKAAPAKAAASNTSTKGKAPAKTGDAALVTPPDLSGAGTNDQPLLPYTAGADVLAAVPARYHESDTVRPQKEGWGPEKIQLLQQQMADAGLYGSNSHVVGHWFAADQEALTALLTEANVNRRSMTDQLKEWSIRPPTPDDLRRILGTKAKPPLTVQLTNPMDVQTSAENVSQQLLGYTDRGFVNSAPAGYNAAETTAQTAAYDTANATAGGTSYQAPDMTSFLENKLRKEKPLEVDANSFLNTWDNFLNMLGPGGGHLQKAI